MLKQDFFTETLSPRERQEALVESKLQRHSVDKGKDNCDGINNVCRLEIPVAHSLFDDSAHSLAHPLIHSLVDRSQCGAMQGLAPQGHEHGPEFAISGSYSQEQL